MTADLFDISGTEESPAIVLRVVAHAGAGRSAVAGQHGDALKLKIAAPPVDGRANQACVELVAELLGVPAAQVELVSGQSSRTKRFRVEGVDPEHARRLLTDAVERSAGGDRPRAKRR
ncbi:MAG TPA: DUF167 domain-containing protein [Acidimicrobiales bacterium]|nr:DUF167 domain-containing protein [Acidimicrobiales bacterium]